jgi:hypothetical protein
VAGAAAATAAIAVAANEAVAVAIATTTAGSGTTDRGTRCRGDGSGRRAFAALAMLNLGVGKDAQSSTWGPLPWPEWSGHRRRRRPLPDRLDPAQPLWQRDLGEGHSSPCVSGGRVFSTSADDDAFTTWCLDPRNGDVVWHRSIGVAAREKMHDVNSAASPTSTADGSGSSSTSDR